MIELSCSCNGFVQAPVGQGVISAKTSMRLGSNVKITGRGYLQSPSIKPDYKKCLPTTLIETAIGEGPIYDIKIDPYEIENCYSDSDYNNYYSNEYCGFEDGKIKEEILEKIVNEGEAVIEYKIGIEPNFLEEAIGNEVVWISPALVDKNYEKEYDVSYNYSNLPDDPLDIYDPDIICCDSVNVLDPDKKRVIDIIDPNYESPCDCCPRPRPGQRPEAIRARHNVVDSQLSKDGRHYVFAYKKLHTNEIIIEVHDRAQDSWAYLTRIKTGLTNFGALAIDADATIIAVSDHKDSSVYENAGRVKIYQYDVGDKEYVRVDQFGFSAAIAKSFTGKIFDFNYQDDIRTARNFIFQRLDDEVVILGDFPAQLSDSFSEVSEDLINVDRIFNTTNEEDFFRTTGSNSYDNYLAILKDKTVRTWGTINIPDGIAQLVNGKAIDAVSSKSAFSVLTEDGTVESWGDVEKYSFSATLNDNVDVSDKLVNVTKISSNSDAFAAVRSDGQVVTFSSRSVDRKLGGNPYVWSASNSEPISTSDLSDVDTVVGGNGCFAAITNYKDALKGNTLVAWGLSERGGDLNKNLFGSIIGVQTLKSNRSGFSGLTIGGKLLTWGSIDVTLDDAGTTSEVTTYIHPSITDVNAITFDQSDYVKSQFLSETFTDIVANLYAFAAIRSDGQVVTWGNPSHGGLSFLRDPDSLPDPYDSTYYFPDTILLDSESDLSNVKSVYGTSLAFAALKNNNSVVTWGNKDYGADSSAVNLNNIDSVHSTVGAFAAINKLGGVVAWGSKEFGGDTSFNNTDPTVDLTSGVVEIYATKTGFIAFKDDGSIVGWGDRSNFRGIDGVSLTGIYGRTKNFGLGYSLSLNDVGDILIVGNKKRTFVSNSFEVGSIKTYKRNPNTLRWSRLGQEIKTNVAQKMALGRMVKSNFSGSRFAAYQIVREGIEFKPRISIYDLSGSSWSLSHYINLFEHDVSKTPFENIENNIRIPHSLDISSDGSTVAFGSTTSEGDTLNGKVVVYKYDTDTSEFTNSGIINPDPLITSSNTDWNPSRLFGENVSLSSDGNKILVSSRESASIYEYSFILDYSIANDWQKISQVFSYDNPKIKTFYQSSDDNSSFSKLISAHMSSGADFVSTTHFENGLSNNNQYGHYVYKIDLDKDIDRYDYDLNNNYLSFLNATVQQSGDYSQLLYTKDSSLTNSVSELGISQSIAIGKKSPTSQTTYAFWSDVKLRTSPVRVITFGNHKISLKVTSQSFDRRRKIQVIFEDGTINKTLDGSLIAANQYDELFHFVLSVDKEQKEIKLYEGGLLLDTFEPKSFNSVADPLKSYVGGFSSDNSPSQIILDDVRCFNRLLTRNEIFKLANHRKLAYRLDEYFYDVVSADCNSFRLEFTSGSYQDIPISNFCTEFINRNDCGKVIDSGCVLDARIKFCYYTGFPRVVYVKSFSRSRNEDVSYINNPSIKDVVVPLNNCELIQESDEPINVYGSDFFGGAFIVGSNHVEPFDSDTLLAEGFMTAQESMIHSLKRQVEGSGNIFAWTNINFDVSASGLQHASLVTTSKWLEKFNGDFADWTANQIIYPKQDVTSDGLVNNLSEETNLYDSINEGVFSGPSYINDNYTVMADDTSYITASSVNTEFEANYKFTFTDLGVRPSENRLRIRMSGPLTNYESKLPPRFHFSDIKMEDPDGGLICQYEDFTFIGDSNQYIDDNNFVIYSLKPKINYSELYQWQDNYPNLYTNSNHTLSFNIVSEDMGNPYTQSRFGAGFLTDYDYGPTDEEYREFFGASGLNPSLRISAVEIYASGRKIPYKEDFINAYLLGQSKGGRIERVIKPVAFLMSDFDTGVRPAASSIWENNENSYNNSTSIGALDLLSSIRQSNSTRYITTHNDASQSGKLVLQFGHSAGDTFYEVKPNSFSQSSFSSIFARWFDENEGVFNAADKIISHQDGFFLVEDIKLRVLAKKNSDAEDFVLDVVGYSDDCIIHVTPAMGGFLQNTPSQGVVDFATKTIVEYLPEGTVPTQSGFNDVDDLGLAGETLSFKDQYYEDNDSNNLGGDHDLITTYPVVSGTEFKWYEIPLRIYKDDVELGRIVDYTQSTFLEKLYLDIYPIPSGASIAAIELAVRYNPQNTLEMLVEGGEYRKIQDGRSEGSFYPVARKSSSDFIFNAGSGYAPLSTIEGIPHAYTSPETIKTNYSRRWRGVNGIAGHAFNINEFDRGFDERTILTPFTTSYIDFSDLYDDAPNSVVFRSESCFDNASGYFYEDSTPTSPEIHRNIGMRFSSGTMFGSLLPDYSGAYKTADWTSLNNGTNDFTNHELYGQIFDGYDRVTRFGVKSSLELSKTINPSGGLSAFIRFIPDANVSGVGFNLYDSSTLFSSQLNSDPTQSGLVVGFSNGKIFASGSSFSSNFYIEDDIFYSGYQYPLSVLFTYDENADKKARLYIDNELYAGDFNQLRATSDAINLEDLSDKFTFGYAGSSVSGLPMLVTEVGVSESGNILRSDAEIQSNQISVSGFFDNIRVKFFNPKEDYNNDNFNLWSYIDENTYTDWYLGAFRGCEFNSEYDSINSINGKKTGRDFINFNLDSDGSSYLTYATKDMPSSVDSGVSYHSQIENDFVRFYLSDSDPEFHSTYKRVTKSLPRGYDFAEKALVVESIIEHLSSGDIIWEDGNIGPKFIVSLYTKNKEPYYVTDEPNWGLVNRHYHYLQPSSCLIKLDSTFTYGDYCDKSEQWALYPEEKKLSELTEKYFSTDVDDMFVQYDIVYPSGSAFKSNLNVHAMHVRAEEAWVKPTSESGSFNLYSSGNMVEFERFELYISGVPSGIKDDFGLYTSGYLPVEVSGDFILCVSGSYASSNSMNLYTTNYESFNNGDGGVVTSLPPYADFVVGNHDPSQFGFFLVTSGAPEPVITTLNNLSGTNGSGMGMFIDGLGYTSGVFPLSISNNQRSYSKSGVFNLSAFANSGIDSIQSSMPIFMLQDYQASAPENYGDASGNFGLKLIGGAINDNARWTYLDLFMKSYYPLEESGILNLFIDKTPDPITRSGMLDLLIQNNNLRVISNVPGTPLVYWANDKYGQPIEIQDNIYATFDADDEIRGVDLYGYGSCDGDSPDKAFDQPLVVDDVVYRPKTCNDGGIFRATATYTNEEAGYQDNYYGIRKYSGLQRGRPYLVNLKLTTGSTDPIALPNQWEEWEYGMCDPSYDSMCCTSDCDQALAFSGVKFIGDYPYLSGDASLIDISGRQAGDNYGKSIKVKNNLFAVGAPNHNIYDASGYYLENAGAVYLYRRNEEVAGKKAGWELEEKLLLPLGSRRDFVSRKTGTLINFGDFSIAGQQWEIGQEGRELGYSLDICQSGNREVVVAGGPGAAWSRTFPSVETSGIPIFMMLFTDKFTYNKTKLTNIINTARKYDILYKYFSAPWGTDPDIWHPQLDVNLLICQLYTVDNIDDLPSVPNSREPWFNHLYLNDVLDPDLDKNEAINVGVSGVIQKFKEIFPYKNSVHSGIPPIVGIFGDDTFSTNFTQSFKPVLDGFLDFYSEYSLQSGVYDSVTNTAKEGYVNQIFDDAFNWDEASVEIMNKTLATGNLIDNGNLNFITSGVGQEWARDDSIEFQSPPESGGRVYIFEKEYGEWNLVQDIISPEELDLNQGYDTDGFSVGYGDKKVIDRFGHAVSISDNSEIISVGSPYINEACQIYERDDQENERMFSVVRDWLLSNNDPYTKDLQHHINKYNLLITASGARQVQEEIYKDLSKLDKFLLRKNKDIQLYKKIYNYDYTDIQYTGTWGVIPKEFAGTSRLGFSTATSEDGNIVAFGAPTDSFNEFDDFNVWYGGTKNRVSYPKNNTWASYTNAGAVRVFESRKYFPHNKAVEFYKFGNLDRSVNQDKDNLKYYYNNLGDFFDVDGVDFQRTQFEDIEIPKDAGLAFIITPEIDAASDEIIDNIKSWLAYGDRTLVLVGNDPIWEGRGLYEKSNNIINKILTKLGSRMRIVPARTLSESLPNGVTQQGVVDLKYNTLPARLPKFLHPTHARRGSIFASGVADIKIDLSDIGREDFLIYHPCDPDNFDRCGLPLKHMGDIRAGWDAICAPKVEYQVNWGFHFDTPNPAQGCDFYPVSPKPELVIPHNEITPVIAAAEYKTQPPIIIPASSGTEEVCTTTRTGTRTETIVSNSTTYSFGQETVGEPVFIIKDTEDGLSGIFNSFNRVNSDYTKGFFYNPTELNGRNGIIQAKGSSFYGEPIPAKRKVSDLSVFVAQETFTDNDTNKLYMIASTVPENAWSMGDLFGDEFDPRNQDQNIAFYNNLVMGDCSTAANIYQLGDWTGRSSMTNASSDSVLEKILKKNGHNVISNAVTIPSVCNVLWIADPLNKPTEEGINRIKTWLAEGNKKIVITYGSTQESADNVAELCDAIGIGTKPYFVNGDDNNYYVQDTDIVRSSNLTSCCPVGGSIETKLQLLNEEDAAVLGCDSYKWIGANGKNTHVDKLSVIPSNADPVNLSPEIDPNDGGYTSYAYIPIKVGDSGSPVVTFRDPIYENYTENPDLFWTIDAKKSSIEFPVVQDSGYRLFVEWISETDQEKYDILAIVSDATVKFSADPGQESSNPADYADKYLDKTPKYSKKRQSWDFRVKQGYDSVTITFDTDQWKPPRISSEDEPTPFTPRVLAVSGYLIPIEIEYSETSRTKSYPIFETTCKDVPWYSPARTIEQPDIFRAISTNHQKYCNPAVDICQDYDPNLDVEDGPLIVADELEHFTSFDQGLNRSRIILITDSTIIQGQSPHFRSDVNSENGLFIRSLYPQSPEKSFNQFSDFSNLSPKGRRFEFTQKLRAPEKGSPAKYYAASGLGNLVERYGFNGVAGNLEIYTDQEDTFVLGDVLRLESPKTPTKIKQAIEFFGEEVIPDYGVFPRFSGMYGEATDTYDPKYIDADIKGGVSRYMEERGHDYLEFLVMNSGYPGDLFGYSVDIFKDKLVVGAPFNGFNDDNVVTWSGVTLAYNEGNAASGLKLGRNGGGGSAFYYERTGRGVNAVSEFLPWEFKQKIKKSDSIGVGNDTTESGSFPDRFGYSVAINSDFIAIGAPCHDYETLHHHIYSGTSSFLRKEFTSEFAIPDHKMYDLGASGIRVDDFNNLSGTMILNNGAVYTYRNQVTNFEDQPRSWVFVEKKNAQGYLDRTESTPTTSGTDGDFFGYSVALDRPLRKDGDYILTVGAPEHLMPTSGNHATASISGAGAAYTFDAMLREQPASIPNPGSYIKATVFGLDGTSESRAELSNTLYQNTIGASYSSTVSGIVYANLNGEIFLEVSGVDPASQGFVSHRPYVESVIGEAIGGTEESTNMSLRTIGKEPEESGVLPISILGDDSAIVYNSIDLYTLNTAVNEVGSGTDPFNLYISGAEINSSGTLWLTTSGIGISEIGSGTDPLGLRIRGK